MPAKRAPSRSPAPKKERRPSTAASPPTKAVRRSTKTRKDEIVVSSPEAKSTSPTSGSDSDSDGSDDQAKKSSEPLLADQADRWQKWRVRTISTLLMLSGFSIVIYLGHIWVALMVVVMQGVIFGEIVGLRYKRMIEYGIPHFRFLTWYFYGTCVFYGYGKVVKGLTKYTDSPLFRYHDFLSFGFYALGILMFVLNLKQGLYRRQFGQFAWTHMTLMLVVVQSTLMISNIFGGLIWFLLPVFCVIANDIMAFIFGFFWGKTPLIKLSPKKTWEGFIGGLVATVGLSFLFAGFMASYDMFICPLKHLSWKPVLSCATPAGFRSAEWAVPSVLSAAAKTLFNLDWRTVNMRPVQVHALVFSLFASLVAPFGGFFASGFKRAFRIKDFGDSIPGHGGLTDRMDCQILMALFVNVYVSTFVAPERYSTVEAIVAAALSLPEANQKEIIARITAALSN